MIEYYLIKMSLVEYMKGELRDVNNLEITPLFTEQQYYVMKEWGLVE